MLKYFSLILALLPLAAYGATRQEVIARCKNAASRNDTICIGYDAGEECSEDVSKCEFAFAAISSVPAPPSTGCSVGGEAQGGSYKVQLVGKGGGWVSLAFSDNEEKMMTVDNLGVICVNTVEPPIQILQIANIPPVPEVKKGFALDNTYLSEGVSNGKLELHNGWMVCEFTLSSTIRHKDKTFNLREKPLKLGLAVNVEDTIHGPEDMYANLPYYHGQTRGASEKFVNVFQKL